jgi:apolipoprotein D and lipocalin family protein
MNPLVQNRFASFVLLLVLIAGCVQVDEGLPPLQTVPHVEIERYLGTWYEIARYPHPFQKGCVATRAIYSLREDGQIDVYNECRENELDGPLKSANGRARVVDELSQAKLEVTFFWPFWGDYWVIDLDNDYRWAVVGHPSRKYLWILSREPSADEAVLQGILERLRGQRYETERLLWTLHP